MRAYIFLFLSILLISCTKAKVDSALQKVEMRSTSEAETTEEILPLPRYNNTSAVSFERLDAADGAFHTDAHAAYVNDALTFVPFPDQGVKYARTAVVGSRVCMLYPESDFDIDISNGEASIKNENDMHGTPVPFASISDRIARFGTKAAFGVHDLRSGQRRCGNRAHRSFENVSKDTRDMQKRSGGQTDKRRRKSMDTRNRRRTRKIRFGSQRFRRCVHERR